MTGNAAISDFAPDASDGAITAVPEPASFALLGLGLAFVGAAAPSPRGLTGGCSGRHARAHGSDRVYPRVFDFSTMRNAASAFPLGL